MSILSSVGNTNGLLAANVIHPRFRVVLLKLGSSFLDMSKPENLSQFFKEDNKTVILPIDHGTVIPIDGLLRKPMELIEQVDNYVDGYVVNYGVAEACRYAFESWGLPANRRL